MKKTLIDKAVEYFSPKAGLDRKRSRILLDMSARYEGASDLRNPNNRGTTALSPSQNTENRLDLAKLRKKHRVQVQNNALAKTACEVRTNITVGTGMIPVARIKNAKNSSLTDQQKNKVVLANKLMKDWINSTFCDASGHSNFFGLQSIVTDGLSISGESLIARQIERNKLGLVPLRLSVMEGDLISNNSDTLKDGREIVQGVALSSTGSGEVAGYYLYDSHPGDNYRQASVKFKPADSYALVYKILRPGQLRGLPAGISAMSRMNNLDELMDSIITQQKVAAALAIFVSNPEGQSQEKKTIPDQIQSGMITQLNDGQQVWANSPPALSGQEALIRKEEMMIAKAYDITYEALTGDNSNANFSSSKIGQIQMLSNARRIRRHTLIPMFFNKIEKWWLEAAALAGHDLSEVRFEWGDPLVEVLNLRDEIPAMIKQVRAGFLTYSSFARQLGYPDYKTMAEEMAADNAIIDDLKLVLDSDPRKTTNSGQLQSLGSGESNPIGANNNADPGAEPENVDDSTQQDEE